MNFQKCCPIRGNPHYEGDYDGTQTQLVVSIQCFIIHKSKTEIEPFPLPERR